MGFENQQTNLNIVALNDTTPNPTIVYVSGGTRCTIDMNRFIVTSKSFDNIAMMNITTPEQVVDAIHETILLSYNIYRNTVSRDIDPTHMIEVIYNVIRDRYKLPIPAAKIAESLYAERKYYPLVRDIDKFIYGIISSRAERGYSVAEASRILSVMHFRDQTYTPACDTPEEENPYPLNLDMEMKGLTVEQYSELITLVTSYIKKNNANGQKNCSLVIK